MTPRKRAQVDRAVTLPPLPRLPKHNALTHGRYAQPENRSAAQRGAIGNIDDFRAGLVADQGELSTIRAGYIERLCEAEALVRLLGHALQQRGVFGRAGRTLQLYLATCERWDRTARCLGMERRTRDVPISPVEWLAQQHADVQAPAGVPVHEEEEP